MMLPKYVITLKSEISRHLSFQKSTRQLNRLKQKYLGWSLFGIVQSVNVSQSGRMLLTEISFHACSCCASTWLIWVSCKVQTLVSSILFQFSQTYLQYMIRKLCGNYLLSSMLHNANSIHVQFSAIFSKILISHRPAKKFPTCPHSHSCIK